MASKADPAAKSKDLSARHSGPVIIKAHNLKNRVPLSSLANVGCKKEARNSWITNATVYPRSDSTSAAKPATDPTAESDRSSASNSVEFALQSLFNSDTSIIVSTPNPKLTPVEVDTILRSPEKSDDDLTIVFDSYASQTAPNLSDAKPVRSVAEPANAKTKVLILRKKSGDYLRSGAVKGGNLSAKCSKSIKCDLVNGRSVENIDRNKSNQDTDRITPGASSMATNIKLECKSVKNVCDSTVNCTSQGPNSDKEVTFVQVEDELEKMFAGIEDSCDSSTKKLNLPAPSVAKNVSSPNSQPLKSKNLSTSVNIPTKTNKRNLSRTKSTAKGRKDMQNSSNSSKESSIDPMKKIPTIRIEDSKPNHINTHIVNSIKSEDEEASRRTTVKRKLACSDPAVKTTTSNFAVNNHDSASSDASWVCVFCNLSANVQGMAGEAIGDLFGPYFIRLPNQINSDESKVRSWRTAHPEQVMKKQKGLLVTLPPSDDQKSVEIWAHENCIVWASGVHLIGSKLIGLEEAVMQALETICVHCSNRGASIGCRARNCNSCVHCSCALHTGWKLDTETFISTCRVHSAPSNA